MDIPGQLPQAQHMLNARRNAEMGRPTLTPRYADLGNPVGSLDALRRDDIEYFLSSVALSCFRSVVQAHNADPDTLVDDLLKVPEKRDQLIVPNQLLDDLRQGIWTEFASMEMIQDRPLLERHFHTWVDSNFRTLHDARKTIFRLTIKPITGGPVSIDDLGEQILKMFRKIKIGPTSELKTPAADYDSMRTACAKCVNNVASVKLQDIYRHASKEEYEKVIQYYGADYLTALLRRDHFQFNFETMDDLIAYIDEDISPVHFRDDTVRTDALCVTQTRNSLYQALMGSMTEDLRFQVGLGREDRKGVAFVSSH